MSNKLSGINPLSYVGVNATTPPQMLISKVDPTDKDFYNYAVGTLWLNESGLKKLWVLLDAAPKAVNRWGQIYPEASGGTNYFVTEAGTATSSASVLNVLGGTSIITSGSGDTLSIDLASDVDVDGNLTVGSLDEIGFVRSYPTGPLGFMADSTDDGKVIISSSSGVPAWASLSAGANVSITPGPNSITISAGGGGGGALTFSGTTGTALADAGAMAIDGDGSNITTAASGTGATAKVTITMADSPSFSTVTADDLTLTGFADGVLVVDGSGVTSASAGADGEILIGATGAAPAWGSITEGNNISITGAANSISIAADIGFAADSGTADMTAGTISILGDAGNITTAAITPGGNPQIAISMASSPSFGGTVTAGTGLTVTTGDVTISDLDAGVLMTDSSGVVSASDPGVAGQVLISSSLAAPAWADLTAGANVSIVKGDGSITINASGGSGGALNFTGDTGSTTASAATMAIVGDAGNITTAASGSGSGATLTVTMSSTPDFSSVDTVNLAVSGQPTFSNIGAGIIVSDVGGDLSAVAPNANGQIQIGAADNSIAWGTLTAGAGIGVTNGTNSITISTPAAVTFAGTSGTATAAGSLKVLGDGGNITTTASGTGATAQVAVAMAASPTFTTTSTTNLTVSGFTGGVLKSNGSGSISATPPTADGQLLIGASTGASAWAVMTSTDNSVTITKGASTIDLSASGSQSPDITGSITTTNSVNDATCNVLKYQKNRASGNIVADDYIGSIRFDGYYNGGYVEAGAINCKAVATVQSHTVPGAMEFKVRGQYSSGGGGTEGVLRTQMALDDSGVLTLSGSGIASTAPCLVLTNGIIQAVDIYANTVTGRALYVSSTGKLGYVSSTMELKENINTMQSESEGIFSLRPVTFNFKDDPSKKKECGLIAEEVVEILPDLAYIDNGKPVGVAYEKLPVLLLNEIIKLRKRIEDLEARL